MSDCREWLEQHDLGHLMGVFSANDVDVDVVALLDDDDLRDIGVSLGDRRRLARALETTPPDRAPGDGSAWHAREGRAERRQLTVMFVDLVGSTALSERLDPEDMRSILTAFQTAVADAITSVDGLTAKLMGDGVLAYFGWPTAHEDDAERAVRAGLAICRDVPALTTSAPFPLATRVGIATGPVVVGDLIGEGAAQEEAVVGETPNIAARLEAMAEPGTVVVSAMTRSLIGDRFEIEDLGLVPIRGLSEPAGAHRVVGLSEVSSRFAAQRGRTLTPLVGRDQEFALLLERWRTAVSGEGQVVVLSGEAGIGKSRLTQSLVDHVTAHGESTVLRHQCSPYHLDTALHPVIEQVSRDVDLRAGDPPDTAIDKIATLVGHVDGATLLVAGLLGVESGTRLGVDPGRPETRRSRLLEALAAVATRRPDESPTLWVIEDAHWIDPTTLELIETALDDVSKSPVLLLVTARPDFHHALGGHPAVTRLGLNRLGRRQASSIIRTLSESSDLPSEIIDEIVERSDGIPLFVEEITKAVLEIDSTAASVDERAAPGPRLTIPPTLHDSLMARLDRLRPVKEVAQHAAVIGRSFDHATLASLSELPTHALEAALDHLVEAELVFRRGYAPECEYLFRHALVRDAAYESLLRAERTALHQRLLAILDPRKVGPGVLAQHAEQAGQRRVAIDHWESAAAMAAAQPAFREASSAFGAAAGLASALREESDRGGPQWRNLAATEARLLVQRAQALIACEGFQARQTLDAFRRAADLADELDDPELQLPAIFGLWAGRYISGGDFSSEAQRFITTAERVDETGPAVTAARIASLLDFHAARYGASLEHAERSIAGYDPGRHADLAHRFGHDQRAAAANYRVWNLWFLGRCDESILASEQAVAWAQEINHPNTTGLVLAWGGALPNLLLGRPEAARGYAEELLVLAEELSLTFWHAWATVLLGWSDALERPAQGIDRIESGVAALESMRAGRMMPLLLAVRGEVRLAMGDTALAEASVRKANALIDEQGDEAWRAEVTRISGLVDERLGSTPGSGQEGLRRARALARRQGAHMVSLRAGLDLARLCVGQHRPGDARTILAEELASGISSADNPDVARAMELFVSLDG